MSNYLIIGNGVAGTTAAENIRKIDKKGNITMVTGEDLPFYYRIRLNEYISGEIEENDLVAKKEKWYRDQNINLELVTRIVGAKDKGKALITENNRTLSYDRLLIATGSHSFIPPIKGSEKKASFPFARSKTRVTFRPMPGTLKTLFLLAAGCLALRPEMPSVSWEKRLR